MAAFILAGAVALATLALAILSELARGMATAPSMHRSRFVSILSIGLPIAALIAVSHWLPHIGW